MIRRRRRSGSVSFHLTFRVVVKALWSFGLGKSCSKSFQCFLVSISDVMEVPEIHIHVHIHTYVYIYIYIFIYLFNSLFMYIHNPVLI